MFERSDETLVKQALKGKKSAWVALVKRYEKNVYNYTYRMVSNGDDAMDLMQDIFMAVFRNLASFRGDSPFKGWLFKIAHYRCIEFYRKKRPTQSLDEAPEQVAERDAGCPEYHMSSTEQASELQRAMQYLSFNQKLVVELKFFQQCTFEDIALQLGISTNTAKSRLYSALDKLKDQLEVGYV
ncbi:RNA polymerase sigma factor [Thalassomonas haliotis]|uniref:Sigma-70 family RNA polymerase sigma factor n=1 Tax=Thalassomonas haliotis TaxID=485448 RepID=A0ABY7VHG6_9GAMM|nr:sigma-70 family RNA polymerase sigma factor [Thalassomonas haliotis]WDE13174.1 sigma-70 family RNA polymerase sigma factor [Thalassomonas haliotis]